LKVTYRATGALRPVRGCTTTRTEWAPAMLLPAADGAGVAADTNYDWLDPDWGTNASNVLNSSSLGTTDAPYTNYVSGIRHDESGDKLSCPILNLDKSSPGKKIHIQGLLYAPSAAMSLSGTDNDASWATDGIVARQITAFRWAQGGGNPAIGGASPVRNNRKFTIEVRDNSGKVLLRELIQVDDNYFQVANDDTSDIGRGVTVVSAVRNPDS